MKNVLKSPINGSDLSFTNRYGIMYSEVDGLFYQMTDDGKIVQVGNEEYSADLNNSKFR